MASVVKSGAMRPPTEAKPAAPRRRFTAQDEERILAEAAAWTKPGELGALLRREGIYSSHLSKWRQQAAAGRLAALEPK